MNTCATYRACGIAPDGTRVEDGPSEKSSTLDGVLMKHPEVIDVRPINTTEAVA